MGSDVPCGPGFRQPDGKGDTSMQSSLRCSLPPIHHSTTNLTPNWPPEGNPKGAEPPTGAESPTGAPLLGFGVMTFTVTPSESSLLEGSVSMGVAAKTDQRLRFLSVEHLLLFSMVPGR